jgi:hypothetical protein
MPTKKAKEWSAAGAARFAREARISTAQFLASSPLARPGRRRRQVHSWRFDRGVEVGPCLRDPGGNPSGGRSGYV